MCLFFQTEFCNDFLPSLGQHFQIQQYFRYVVLEEHADIQNNV